MNKSLIVRLDLCLGRMKECNVRLIYSIQFFFSDSVTTFLIWHVIIPHIYAPILLIFHPFLKTNRQHSLRENTRSVVKET